jgi:hypothetical protein
VPARNASSRSQRPSFGAASSGPIARLAQARGVIEGKFLDLGKVLETSVDVVGGLIAGIDDLAKVLDQGAVEQATANLAHAAAQLNGLSHGRGDHRAGFQAVAEATLKLGAHIQAMQQALRYLHVFAVNIKVTAGGVPGASIVFADFAEEVLAAIAEGRAELAEFERELDALRSQVGDALNLEAELDRRCAELLPATPQRLAADAATLADHHRKVAATTADVGAIARSLQGKVSGALCSLQIGDTTRQRAEHVEDGFAMAADARANRGLTEAGEATIRAMLAAQLHDMVDVFNGDMDRMAVNLTGVASDAREVLRLRSASRGGGASDKEGGVLARLEASLADTMSLVGDLENAEASARDLRASAEATAAGLGRRIGAIRRIRAGINQMALNANLKCVRLGDAGKPLSVIAVELRVSADDLGDRAGQAEQILAGLAREPAAEGSGALGASGVGDLLEAAVAPIRAAEAKAGADLAALAERSEGMIAQLRQATDRLDFHGAVSDVMIRVADEICAAGVTPPADDVAFADVMAEIGKLYTMARERQVHKRFEAPETREAAAA